MAAGGHHGSLARRLVESWLVLPPHGSFLGEKSGMGNSARWACLSLSCRLLTGNLYAVWAAATGWLLDLRACKPPYARRQDMTCMYFFFYLQFNYSSQNNPSIIKRRHMKIVLFLFLQFFAFFFLFLPCSAILNQTRAASSAMAQAKREGPQNG